MSDPDATTLECATYLRDQLGECIAAYLVGLGEVAPLLLFCEDPGAEPDIRTRVRLREGRKIVMDIVERYDADTARAWLFGTNEALDDEAPADVLRDATEPAEFAELRGAATRFIYA